MANGAPALASLLPELERLLLTNPEAAKRAGELVHAAVERRISDFADDLDPDRVPETARAPFVAALLLVEILEGDPEAPRTPDEWLYVAGLIALAELPGIPAEHLGLRGEDYPWGGFDEVGDDTFGHRDGIRQYADLEDGGIGRLGEVAGERRRALDYLARRAVGHLGNALLTLPDEDGGRAAAVTSSARAGLLHPREPEASERKTMLESWGVKGKRAERRRAVLRFLSRAPERCKAVTIAVETSVVSGFREEQKPKARVSAIARDCKAMSRVVAAGRGRGGYMIKPELRERVLWALGEK